MVFQKKILRNILANNIKRVFCYEEILHIRLRFIHISYIKQYINKVYKQNQLFKKIILSKSQYYF